jgi:hypothetical protein
MLVQQLWHLALIAYVHGIAKQGAGGGGGEIFCKELVQQKDHIIQTNSTDSKSCCY